MTNFAFQQVDVFTSRPLLGNPLAVVVGAVHHTPPPGA
jgi:predicted PhzF superfamily epimerase YddE/YHI9